VPGPGLRLILAAGAVLTAALPGQEPGLPLAARWQEGLRLETRGGEVALRLNLRIHWDVAVPSGDARLERRTGSLQAATGFRRARILLRGRLGEGLRWRSETDFRTGAPKFLSQYGEADLGRGLALRAGHFREPMGLEANTSGSRLLFLERSPVAELTPGRNSGLALLGSHREERLTWAAGVFRDSDRVGRGTGPGGWALTARVGVRPWLAPEGRGWLHLGAASTFRDTAGAFQVAAAPGTFLLPAFADTGRLPASAVRGLGMEVAAGWEGLTVFGEWSRWEVGMPGAGDPDLQGATLQAAWRPGGSRRSFEARKGGLGGVEEPGCVELVLGWSRLDLRETAPGQRLESLAVGLTFFRAGGFRIAGNLVRAALPGAPPAWIPVLRLALDL